MAKSSRATSIIGPIASSPMPTKRRSASFARTTTGRSRSNLIMNDIWVHEKMRGGYSAVKIFENEDFYISEGGLNGYSHAKQFEDSRIILINFKALDLTVVGGGAEIESYRKQANQTKIKNWAFRLLLDKLDIQWFKWLLD